MGRRATTRRAYLAHFIPEVSEFFQPLPFAGSQPNRTDFEIPRIPHHLDDQVLDRSSLRVHRTSLHARAQAERGTDKGGGRVGEWRLIGF
jgi:hypothetical protein